MVTVIYIVISCILLIFAFALDIIRNKLDEVLKILNEVYPDEPVNEVDFDE